MERTPEPELMDTAEQAEAYAIADFTEPNRRFVELFRARFPDFVRGAIVDLGCGPADIPIRLARALPSVRVTAVDGAQAMLEHAATATRAARLDDRIELVRGVLPGAVPGDRTFDAAISNSLLHHLHDPSALWNEIKKLAKPSAPIFVIDLMRPASIDDAHALVEKYSANERPILKQDFYNSLRAAFTIDEVRAQLDRAGLSELSVEAISDRHLSISGLRS
jgi:SAM-dependent methyltransferase